MSSALFRDSSCMSRHARRSQVVRNKPCRISTSGYSTPVHSEETFCSEIVLCVLVGVMYYIEVRCPVLMVTRGFRLLISQARLQIAGPACSQKLPSVTAASALRACGAARGRLYPAHGTLPPDATDAGVRRRPGPRQGSGLHSRDQQSAQLRGHFRRGSLNCDEGKSIRVVCRSGPARLCMPCTRLERITKATSHRTCLDELADKDLGDAAHGDHQVGVHLLPHRRLLQLHGARAQSISGVKACCSQEQEALQ